MKCCHGSHDITITSYPGVAHEITSIPSSEELVRILRGFRYGGVVKSVADFNAGSALQVQPGGAPAGIKEQKSPQSLESICCYLFCL